MTICTYIFIYTCICIHIHMYILTSLTLGRMNTIGRYINDVRSDETLRIRLICESVCANFSEILTLIDSCCGLLCVREIGIVVRAIVK